MNYELVRFYGVVRDAFIARIEDDMLLHDLRNGYVPEIHVPPLFEGYLSETLRDGAS